MPNASGSSPGLGAGTAAAAAAATAVPPPFPEYAAAVRIMELMSATVTEPMAAAAAGGGTRPCTAPFLHAACALAAVDRQVVTAAACTLELGQAGAALQEAAVCITLGTSSSSQLRLTASCPFMGGDAPGGLGAAEVAAFDRAVAYKPAATTPDAISARVTEAGQALAVSGPAAAAAAFLRAAQASTALVLALSSLPGLPRELALCRWAAQHNQQQQHAGAQPAARMMRVPALFVAAASGHIRTNTDEAVPGMMRFVDPAFARKRGLVALRAAAWRHDGSDCIWSLASLPACPSPSSSNGDAGGEFAPVTSVAAFATMTVADVAHDDDDDDDQASDVSPPPLPPPAQPWSAASDSMIAKAGRAADACEGRLWAQLPARCGNGGLTIMPHEWPALVAACRGGLVLDLTACRDDTPSASIACDVMALAIGSGAAGLALPAPDAAPRLWNTLHRLADTALSATAPCPLANRIAVAVAKETTAGAAFVL